MIRSVRRICVAALVGFALVVGAGAPAASAESVPEPMEPATSADETEIVEGAEHGELADDAPPATDAVDAASALPPGAGVTVPAGSNEVAADVLGRGYEQVVRLNGSRVEIVEPVTRGGAVLRSFEAGASREWPKGCAGKCHAFYGGDNMAKKLTGHSASRLAVVGTHIYVSALRVKTTPPASPSYPEPDGSITRKFTAYGQEVNSRVEDSKHAVTALDGFVYRGKEYLAIGLNWGGVRVVEPDQMGMKINERKLFTGWDGREAGDHRDQITALKMGTDDQGHFILVAGKLTSAHPAVAAINVDTGRELWSSHPQPGGEPTVWPEVVEILPKFGPQARAMVAIGWPKHGALNLIDLANGTDWQYFSGGVVAVLRAFTDASGEPRMAAIWGYGNVFTSFVARTDAGGGFQMTEAGSAVELPWMVPGYRPFAVQIENRSRDAIRLQPFSGASRAEGCWLTSGLRGSTNPLPAEPVQIPAGGNAGAYGAAHKHWGDSCTPSNPGVSYFQLEPAGMPSQRQVVQIHADTNGALVKDQVGAGRFAIRVEADSGTGLRVVVEDRHAAPTIIGAPVVEAARLTPAPVLGHKPNDGPDDPSRPVYRFTVSGVSWQVPGADGELAEATLPLPEAEASVDGQDWDAIGTVVSPLTPKRAGERLDMGVAVFDWQTEADAKDYRYFRVTAGGAVSNPIEVAGLPAPPPTDAVKGMKMDVAGIPRANGLDQVPMRVSLTGDWQTGLDADEYADLYQRIYYRDASSKALITGLGDSALSANVMFSLKPGQYPNDGIAADASASIGVYFSIRGSVPERKVRAYFKDIGTTKSAYSASGDHFVRGVKNALLADGTGAGGLSIRSCAEGTCSLADPGRGPVLHSLTPTKVSVQFRTVAVPGSASLPLRQSNQNAEQLRLHSDGLRIAGARATLLDPNRFGAAIPTITTSLVTHGERMTLESHYVK
jgi:hypothetical protein